MREAWSRLPWARTKLARYVAIPLIAAVAGVFVLGSVSPTGAGDPKYGPSIYRLSIAGESVKLVVAAPPMNVRWMARISNIHCAGPGITKAWASGTGEQIAVKPPLPNSCINVDSVHVTNTGDSPTVGLRLQRWLAGAPVASSVPVDLKPGYTAWIGHTGSVTLYDADGRRVPAVN